MSPVRPATATKPFYIHATAVMIGETGLLIRGPSRAGKSSLALALLAEAQNNSLYARLIGDDRVSIARSGDEVILQGHPAISGKIEQRGTGILDMPWVSSGRANYVIHLAETLSGEPFAEATTEILSVRLPLFTLSLGPSAASRAEIVMRLLSKAEAYHQPSQMV